MLDILVSVGLSNASIAVQSLESIRRYTDVPFRVVVFIDGGTPNDYADLEEALHDSKHKWILRHRRKPCYFNASLLEMVQEIENEWVALISPEVVLGDEQWFGKMQMPFLRDPNCYFVDAQPQTLSKSLPPVRRTHKYLADNCRFFLSKKRELDNVLASSKLESQDPIRFLEAQALKLGGTVWDAQGVNYYLQPHTEHPACQPSSEARMDQPGSPSSTTPV